jgi:hypothetical protein
LLFHLPILIQWNNFSNLMTSLHSWWYFKFQIFITLVKLMHFLYSQAMEQWMDLDGSICCLCVIMFLFMMRVMAKLQSKFSKSWRFQHSLKIILYIQGRRIVANDAKRLWIPRMLSSSNKLKAKKRINDRTWTTSARSLASLSPAKSKQGNKFPVFFFNLNIVTF